MVATVRAMPPFTFDVEISNRRDFREERIRIHFRNGGANVQVDGAFGEFDIVGARRLADRINAICDAVTSPRQVATK